MIDPALTPEIWAEVVAARVYELDWMLFSQDHGADPYICEGLESHGMAAFCLHGEPFGFTREDVRMLREAVTVPDNAYPWVCSLVERIEALLPPEAEDED